MVILLTLSGPGYFDFTSVPGGAHFAPPMKTILKPTFMPKKLYTLKDIYNSRLHAYFEPPTPKNVTVRAISFFSPFRGFHGFYQSDGFL